jgi:hypothetical protein
MKRVLFTMLLVCFTATPALATDTRIMSMGGKEKAWTVTDEVSIRYFPAAVLHFPNTVYVEAGMSPVYALPDHDGSNVPYNVGFAGHYGLGKNVVLAVFGSSLSRQLSSDLMTRAFGGQGDWATMGVDASAGDQTGPQAINNADHKGGFLVGFRSGKTRIGVGASIWGDRYSVDKPETSHALKGALFVEGSLGIGYDLSETSGFDIGLKVGAGKFDDEKYVGGASPVVTRFKDDTQFSVDAYARGIFNMLGEQFIPYVNIGYEGGGVAFNKDNGVKGEYSGFHLVLGTDFRIKPLDNVFIYPGIGLAIMTDSLTEGINKASETIQDELALVAPFFSVSLDARLASWFSLRFGARQSVLFNTRYHNADGVNKGKDHSTLTEFLLGAGMHFGPVDIELMLNPAWFMEGFWGGDDDGKTEIVMVTEEGEFVDSNGQVGNQVQKYGDGFASQLAIRLTW